MQPVATDTNIEYGIVSGIELYKLPERIHSVEKPKIGTVLKKSNDTFSIDSIVIVDETAVVDADIGRKTDAV